MFKIVVAFIVTIYSLAFCQTSGHIKKIHQSDELEGCTLEGKATSYFMGFSILPEGSTTLKDYVFDGSNDSGKRISAIVLTAFSNDIKVNIVDHGLIAVYCGNSKVGDVYRVEYIELLK